MSSDYYGAIAGDLVDLGAAAKRGYTVWLDEYTRHEPAPTRLEDYHAAFMAGFELATFLAAERVRE